MNLVKEISSLIKDRYPESEITGDGIECFECQLNDKHYSIRIKLKRECQVILPHVHDFRICPACGIKQRQPERRKAHYCDSCREAKTALLLKGITKKSMIGNIEKYHEIIAYKSLLKQLKTQIKVKNGSDRKEDSGQVRTTRKQSFAVVQ